MVREFESRTLCRINGEIAQLEEQLAILVFEGALGEY